jgi:uncharacterized protein (DUF1684 family)
MTEEHTEMATELREYRRQKDEFFRADPGSPLPVSERVMFDALAYYPAQPDLVFDVTPEPFEDPETVVLQTSDGSERAYERWARLAFTVDGTGAALTVFRDPESGHLFLPFRDTTSGLESYGAGRYLEVPVLEQDERGEPSLVYLDFNYAYHPFCAYSPNYSCPLPPGENWLAVPIRAGERNP